MKQRTTLTALIVILGALLVWWMLGTYSRPDPDRGRHSADSVSRLLAPAKPSAHRQH